MSHLGGPALVPQGLPWSFLAICDSQGTSSDFSELCCPSPPGEALLGAAHVPVGADTWSLSKVGCPHWHQTCKDLVGESFSGDSSSLRGAGTVGGDSPSTK